MTTVNIENEVWKYVVGYEGLYMISNIGRIRHLGRIDSMGRLKHAGILTEKKSSNGYPFTKLSALDGSKMQYRIHRIVAQAFIPNPDNKPQVNHKNGIKNDNRIENLEWCTVGDNNRHAIRTGLKAPLVRRGSKHGMAKLTEKMVLEIRENVDNIPNVLLAKKYNVTRFLIWSILKRRTWKHI